MLLAIVIISIVTVTVLAIRTKSTSKEDEEIFVQPTDSDMVDKPGETSICEGFVPTMVKKFEKMATGVADEHYDTMDPEPDDNEQNITTMID